MDKSLIAPCGINCGICSAYLAHINKLPRAKGKITHCSGCRARNKQCALIKGKCTKLSKNRIKFCYDCKKFPCAGIKTLNKRYETYYSVSNIENLLFIETFGIDSFINQQIFEYKCHKCDGMISMHNKKCYKCDEVTGWRN